MKRNIALFFIVIVSSFVAVQPAFAEEHNFQDISQKIENVSQGLAGQEAFDAVVAQATDLIAQLHVPGLAVGVIHGTNAYAAGIGVTNVRTWLPEAKRQRCTRLLLLSESRAKRPAPPCAPLLCGRRPVVTKADSRATGCALILYVLANCLRGGRRPGRLPHRGAGAKCF